MRRIPRKRAADATAFALLAMLTFGVAACGPRGSSSPPAQSASASAKQTPAEIAAKSMPAIVLIRTATGLGSGFIVRKDGLVATNMHVVAGGGAKIVVTLHDGRQFEVTEIANGSPERDLAILRIDADRLPVLAIGDSDAMRPGDPVVAIGHPMGLEETVSNGLASAVRHVGDDLKVLQISAPIAPGSSGGPVFNERGQVVAVATAILREGQNLNFGVPANYVKALLDTLDPISVERFAQLTSKSTRRQGPRREIPEYPVTVLAGCNELAIKIIVRSLADAISAGSSLYNDGNAAACYHVYEGAAVDLERKLPPACRGPAKVLIDGRRRAASLPNPDAQAWAMRDAFDALLNVIERRIQGE